MRRSAVVLVLVVVAIATPAGAALGDSVGGATQGTQGTRSAPSVRADFDGDDAEDVAVGAPGESVGAVQSAGAVNVLYGSGGGLSGAGSQLFHQDIGAIGSTAEEFDTFGAALAVGDFNGDGFDDLAVGAPGESVGAAQGAGAINVLFGSATGLTTTGSQLFTQAGLGGGATSGPGESFGAALAAGDLDGDGVGDLAIGVPFGNADTGSVHVLYGSTGGLTGGRPTVSFNQDSPGLGSSPEQFDQFGAALAVGDFNDSGVSDLAIGAPGEDVGAVLGAGAAHILFGRTTGISGASSQFFTQDTPGISSDAEDFDNFGFSFGAGDLDGDGFADLAFGVPGESVAAVAGGGAINVLYGATGGLTVTGSQVFHQDIAGVGSTAEEFDNFGWALTVGDFNGSGVNDLAVGVVFEDVGTVPDAGTINVLFGRSGTGLAGAGSQLFHQDIAGVGSTAEEFDTFGWALAAGDFNGNGVADLTVGVPFESVGTVPSAGAINIFAGGGPGVGLTGGAVLHQDSPGVGSTAEDFDNFGLALAAPASQTSGAAAAGASTTSATRLTAQPVG